MPDLKSLTATIIAGYLANTKIEADQLPSLIASVSGVLDGLGKADATSEPSVTKPTPGQVRKSITDAGIVSFEDGKTYKSMKRHLKSRGLTPDEYRAKWSLGSDYPIVAPSYSSARSAMAKAIGLGAKGRGARALAAVSEPSPTDAPAKRRGRPPKAISPSDDTFT